MEEAQTERAPPTCGCSKRVDNPTVDEADTDLKKWWDMVSTGTACGLVDFRTTEKFFQKHVIQSTHIPWADFRDRGVPDWICC